MTFANDFCLLRCHLLLECHGQSDSLSVDVSQIPHRLQGHLRRLARLHLPQEAGEVELRPSTHSLQLSATSKPTSALDVVQDAAHHGLMPNESFRLNLISVSCSRRLRGRRTCKCMHLRGINFFFDNVSDNDCIQFL